MDLRILEYFVVITEEKNITRAAEMLHISQPALTKQIHNLEAQIGAQLLIRSKKGVELTEEGMILKKRAEELLSLQEETFRELRGDSSDLHANISIGTGETKYFSRIADCMKRVRQTCPHITFSVFSGDKEAFMKELTGGALDFGVFIRGYDQMLFDGVCIGNESRFGILMRKDDPLAKKKYLNEKDVHELPLFIGRQIMSETSLPAYVNKNRIAGTYTLINSAAYLAEKGVGYILVLNDLCRESDHLVFVPIKNAEPYSWHIIWKKNIISRADKIFISELRKEFSHPSE